MAIAPERYAEGLMRVAIELKKVDHFEEQLNALQNKILNDEFFAIVNYPEYSNSKKANLIKELTKDYLDDYLVRFLEILIKAERINIIRQIINTYKQKAREYRNIYVVEVYSAYELDDEQTARLVNKIKSIFNIENVELKIIIDSSIIGGVKIKKGDILIDGSLETRLKTIKNMIMK